MKKGFVFLSSFLLLVACDMNSVEEDTNSQNEKDTSITEVEKENSTENEANEESNDSKESYDDTTPTTNETHLLANFVNDQTFMDPYALEAWDDYQEIAADADYGDITLVQTETPDISKLNGSSFNEMEGRFNSLDLREDVYIEQVAINEQEELYFYRYPAEEESDLSEVSDFLAELIFYYIEDNLVFSAITPGLYQVELNDLPDVNLLTSFTTLSDLNTMNTQVFTIAELKVNDYPIHQMMIPALFINEEGNEELMAFYFFTHGEDILQYAYLPFEMVSQSFPDNSILLYQQIIPEIAQMDLEESL